MPIELSNFPSYTKIIKKQAQQLAGTTVPSLTFECMKKQSKEIYDNLIEESSMLSVKSCV